MQRLHRIAPFCIECKCNPYRGCCTLHKNRCRPREVAGRVLIQPRTRNGISEIRDMGSELIPDAPGRPKSGRPAQDRGFRRTGTATPKGTRPAPNRGRGSNGDQRDPKRGYGRWVAIRKGKGEGHGNDRNGGRIASLMGHMGTSRRGRGWGGAIPAWRSSGRAAGAAWGLVAGGFGRPKPACATIYIMLSRHAKRCPPTLQFFPDVPTKARLP